MTRWVIFAGALLAVACGPSSPQGAAVRPSTPERATTGRATPRRATPRQATPRRPAVKPEWKQGLAKASKRFRSVHKRLVTAVKKGGYPKVAKLLKGYRLSVPKDCRGRLRANLGLIVVPAGKTAPRAARLRPGVIFAVASAPAPDMADPDSPAPRAKPVPRKQWSLTLCSITAASPGAPRPYALQVVPLDSASFEPPKKLEAEWSPLATGRALLVLTLKEQTVEGPHGATGETSSTGLVLACHQGRYQKLFSQTVGHTESQGHTGGLTVKEVSFKVVAMRSPTLPLVVRVERETTTEPASTGTPGVFEGMETSWSETYRIYQFSKGYRTLVEVKAKCLATVLIPTDLNAYRQSKSGWE